MTMDAFLSFAITSLRLAVMVLYIEAERVTSVEMERRKGVLDLKTFTLRPESYSLYRAFISA